MIKLSAAKLLCAYYIALVLMSCSSTKQLQTQATAASITHSSGRLDDVIRTAGLQEFWIVPTERNGVMVNDTIRHQIDINDTIHHRINVNDTVHHQVLAEQTKGKVPQKQKGLADVLRTDTHEQDATGVWLFISVGFNVLCILVIIIVISLNKNRFNAIS